MMRKQSGSVLTVRLDSDGSQVLYFCITHDLGRPRPGFFCSQTTVARFEDPDRNRGSPVSPSCLVPFVQDCLVAQSCLRVVFSQLRSRTVGCGDSAQLLCALRLNFSLSGERPGILQVKYHV